MDLIETLRTTGAVREFRADAVPDEVLARVLETARFAPSGGNRQGWQVVVLKDPEARRRLRDLYLAGWYEYLSMSRRGLVAWAPITDQAAEADAIRDAGTIAAEAANGPGGFAEHLDEVPVLLVVLVDLRALAAVDRNLPRYTFVGGASLYPFAWSVLLAARAEGLSGVMTTMAIRRERELNELLGAPDHMAVASVIALGYPVRQPRRLTRGAVESFTTVDRVDGTAFAG